MKKFLISMVLDSVFDMLIEILKTSARRSSSKVDDKMVEALTRERSQIIKEIKQKL